MIAIRNCGSYHIENKLTDANNNRIVKDFLKKLSIDFTKKAAKYIKFTKEAPFYGEIQLHSLLAPCLYELTDAFLNEVPTHRKLEKSNSKEKVSSGRLDYWCSIKKRDVFIELKHSFSSLKSQGKEETKTSWSNANGQFKSFKAKDHKLHSKKPIKIILQAVSIYQSSSDLSKLDYSGIDNDELKKFQKELSECLSPKANWSFIWKPNRKVYDYAKGIDDNGHLRYPAILFIAKVF